MWCLPNLDEGYLGQMEEVLGVYEKHYNPAEPVVCIDEKPVCLRSDVREPVAAKPGETAKRDSEYKRRGTANVFCAIEPKAGRHFTVPTPNRSGAEFAKVVKRIVDAYPCARTIHLVFDNLNTHRRKALTDHFGEEAGARIWNRVTPHYTPKHGSWLNQAEIEVSLFSRQCLGKRRIGSLEELRRQATAWSRRVNRAKLKIEWQFTRRKARRVFGYAPHRIRRSKY
jgi:transposase